METIEDVLKYIGLRADVLDDGEWIVVQQVFITRLRDQRFPTRNELDRVAPNNPVFFRTGPDAALNSLALKLSKIDRDFQIPEGKTGKIELDPVTGEPTGIVRSAGELLKPKSSIRKPNQEEQINQLKQLLADYNAVGITSVSDRNASDDGIELYQALKDNDQLTCRVYLYYGISASDSLPKIEAKVAQAVSHPLHEENRELWLRGVKVFLDGGMLTGSAYMKEPWGTSQMYGISDPTYRGIRYIDPEKLYQISKLVLKNNLQMTAHSVGDAAVQTLVETYAQIDKDDFSILGKRPCVTHCNFMTESAIETMSRLSIVADLQPAWLWLDGSTLTKQFGEERMRWFQPYRTLFDKNIKIGGGSDHMQKIGSLRSINPYNPFLGMWIAVQRQPQRASKVLYSNQRISREEAIRLYTINNAFLTFEEQFKGSLEVGKLADFIVIDSDILQCDVDAIKDIQVTQTFLGGKQVFQKSK
jgi:predicted amidohydrolase YtcJ